MHRIVVSVRSTEIEAAYREFLASDQDKSAGLRLATKILHPDPDQDFIE